MEGEMEKKEKGKSIIDCQAVLDLEYHLNLRLT